MISDGKAAASNSVPSASPSKHSPSNYRGAKANMPAIPVNETRRRVKLYALNAEKQWDDKGTGHVSSSYIDAIKAHMLFVRAELDGSLLLESRILPETTYQKQQETLIVWSEGENYDLALSFQERAGCDEIWEKICQVQGKDPSVDTTQDVVDESEDERFSEDNDIMSSADNTFNMGNLELPPAEIGRLEEIDDLISSCISTPLRREKLALVLENDEYLRKLMGVFRMCEDIEDMEGLRHMYTIVKNLFLMNKTSIIEILLQDDLVFDVIGCLEYDPSNRTDRRKHRQFLKNEARFHQIVPASKKDLNMKIHQTYRAQYLHDVALPTPSFFEDNSSTLSSFIFFNKLDIVTSIQKDEQFLGDIFSQLTDENTDASKRRDLVLFLKELCTFSHTLQPHNREAFLKTLSSMGILSALEIALYMENQPVVRAAAIDILNLVVEFSPSLVREYMMNQAGNVEEEQLFSNALIELMICDGDPGLSSAVQLQGIFKIVLDPENMLAAINKSEKTDFLTYFYKHSMHVLTAPLLAHTVEDKPGKDDFQTAALLSLIVDLLGFCVDHHTFHVKNYIIGKDLLRRVLVLLKSSHKYLALCALRLMRKILALKDTFYYTHIMEKNLFEPVVNCLIWNGGRYNLLDSAILEMFEFVKSDIATLYAHIVERFGKRLEAVDYVPTFRDMRKKAGEGILNERIQRDGRFDSKSLGRFRRDPREPDEDEALWFDADEDDDEPASIGNTTIGLPGGVSQCAVLGALPHINAAVAGALPSGGVTVPPGSALVQSVTSSFSSLNSTAAASAIVPEFGEMLAGMRAGVPKATVLGKRGLVDYDGDSDEEEGDHDDGDADCEDEDDEENEEPEEAANAASEKEPAPKQRNVQAENSENKEPEAENENTASSSDSAFSDDDVQSSEEAPTEPEKSTESPAEAPGEPEVAKQPDSEEQETPASSTETEEASSEAEESQAKPSKRSRLDGEVEPPDGDPKSDVSAPAEATSPSASTETVSDGCEEDQQFKRRRTE